MASTYNPDGSYAAGEGHRVMLPVDWPARRGEKPPVVFHHMRNWNALGFIPGFGDQIVRGLTEAGYPLICHVGGSPTNWGNDEAIARTADALEYLRGLPGVRGGPAFHMGWSMGGAGALNYARTAPEEVAGIALVIPALDVDYLHDNTVYGPEIDAAYPEGWEAARPTHDPMSYIPDLAGIPICVWYASNDASAVTERQEAFLAARPETASVNLGAVGHTPQTVGRSEIADYFDGLL